jgi:3-oxoacyl-[acyl-carrier-protein] synthase II
MSSTIVVTGAGVISSLGAGAEEFQATLYSGASGIGPSELFANQAATAEVRNFTPQRWLGNKGIRVLDRSARLLSVAAHMALDAAGWKLGETSEGDAELGLICGTMFGSLHSITSFDWSGLVDGPNYVNPMEFPNTVINSPAGQTAIKYKIRGINSTLCAGLASGLYALHYAAEFLHFQRVRVLLAGGVEELCEESVVGFRKTGNLSPSGSARPFASGRDGTVLGEGAALLVLGSEDTARARGWKPWFRLCGFGFAHDAHCIHQYWPRAEGAAAAMELALDAAGIEPAQVGCIVAGASGSRAGDDMEARALQKVFGPRLEQIPLCAPKAALGELLGASGAFGALVGGWALQNQMLPPTAGFVASETPLRMSAGPQRFDGDFALVNAFSCDGNNASMVLGRYASSNNV